MTPPGTQPDPRADGSAASPQSTSGDFAFADMFHAVAATRSYEVVVRQIEDAIRSGQIQRGERLPTERQLSETFGVSRGVIREAIKVLGAMGLVEARQGSGLFVRNDTIPSVTRAFILSVSPDAESLDKLFEFRHGLEIQAARFAAQRRSEIDLSAMDEALRTIEQAADPLDWLIFGENDNRFHNAVARAGGNPYLEVAIATARDMQRDVVHLIADEAGSIQTAIAQHREIYEAIRDRAPEKAAALMGAHVMYTAGAVQSKIPPGDDRPTVASTDKEHT